MIEAVIEEGRCGGLEWAVCSSAFPGEQRSGDAFLVEPTASGALVAVVDGLGHGEAAADVATRALASLRQTAGRSPKDSLTACHAALRGSRGAVLTLAALDAERGRLVWLAVGNVEAAVVGTRCNGRPSRRLSVPQLGGVVGERLPPLREFTVPFTADDVLVSASDGIALGFLDAVDPSIQTLRLARLLHSSYARSDDDALVLVARCAPAPTTH